MIKAFHHASLLVSDTSRSLQFYQDILGLQVDENRPDLGYPGAWLNLQTMQIHLLQLESPDPTQGRPEHGGRDRHLAFLVEELDAISNKLASAGVDFTVSRSGRKALFCRDPDGNALEFIQPG